MILHLTFLLTVLVVAYLFHRFQLVSDHLLPFLHRRFPAMGHYTQLSTFADQDRAGVRLLCLLALCFHGAATCESRADVASSLSLPLASHLSLPVTILPLMLALLLQLRPRAERGRLEDGTGRAGRGRGQAHHARGRLLVRRRESFFRNVWRAGYSSGWDLQREEHRARRSSGGADPCTPKLDEPRMRALEETDSLTMTSSRPIQARLRRHRRLLASNNIDASGPPLGFCLPPFSACTDAFCLLTGMPMDRKAITRL